jgi:AraC-like DNA-binding protein
MTSSNIGKRKSFKTRRVRYCYPHAMVRLARLLSVHRGARDASRMLSLPLSTVYRWVADSAAPADQSDSASVDAMVAECESHGFRLRNVVREVFEIPERSDADNQAWSAPAPRAVAMSSEIDSGAPETSSRQSKAIAAAHAAKRHIQKHYYDDFSCVRFAKELGITSFHFNRVFRSLFGVPPYRFLLCVRVEQAWRLIEESEEPLDGIATAVGFATTSSLGRAYLSVTKTSLSSAYLGRQLRRCTRVSMHA